MMSQKEENVAMVALGMFLVGLGLMCYHLMG